MKELVTISGEGLAMVLLLPERGMPEIVAFGPAAAGTETGAKRGGRMNGMDIAVPSAVLLPCGGMGFFGWPAIAGHREGHDFTAEFSNWTVEHVDSRTVLSARDGIALLSLAITIEMVGACAVMSVEFANEGTGTYTLDRCMAGSMVIGPGVAELTQFTGMWGREFHKTEQPLGRGLWLQESRRGRTSHDKSPGILLQSGSERLALHLGWSGNHVIAIDLIDDGRRLVHAGELFEPGEMRLAPGGSYRSPKLYVACDPAHLREALRRLVRWPGGAMRPRPVTLNTWEGIYFDHRLDQLKAQADAAAELGIERFVLDDGWFGRRDDDTSSLGDWQVDERKYPQGLKPLAKHVLGLGMEFGIWMEPEMVNPNSDLFRAHPDWALQVEGRRLLTSRHQLVLDLTRPEVSDYLFGCIDKVLGDQPVSYIKWDMNRDLTHAGGRDGRAATSRQTLAAYALMDRVRTAHPDVEIESCASGGGRADYGVLARTHRLWTSDGTDALERLEIQRGARTIFLPEILGSHVSASPNHQTHRRHTLSFRAIVALAYHFGAELNPLTLSDDERAELKGWIALHKRLRPLFHGTGAFHLEPVDGRFVWGALGQDQAVIIVAQGAQMMGEQPPPLSLEEQILAPGIWRIRKVHPAQPDFIRLSEEQKRLLSGDLRFRAQTLTRSGLNIPMLRPESAAILELERIEGA